MLLINSMQMLLNYCGYKPIINNQVCVTSIFALFKSLINSNDRHNHIKTTNFFHSAQVYHLLECIKRIFIPEK